MELSIKDRAIALMKSLRITIASTVQAWDDHDAPEQSPMMYTFLRVRMEQVQKEAAMIAEWAGHQHDELMADREVF